MSKFVFGIDVGGTTVKMGLFDVDGQVLDKWEIPTRIQNNGENILPDIAKAVNAKMVELIAEGEELNRKIDEIVKELGGKWYGSSV